LLQSSSLWALDPRTAIMRWCIAVAAFVAAFLLRYVLDGSLPPGFPFLTFFPAVILTTFFAGLWPGIAVGLVSGISAWYFFIAPQYTFSLGNTTVMALVFYVFIAATDIALVNLMHVALRDLGRERRRSADLAEQRKLMFQELQHRVSNNLATVAGLLTLQRRSVRDDAARKALEQAVARINLVGKMQRMLHDPNAQAVDFGQFLDEMTQNMAQAAGVEHAAVIVVDTVRVQITSAQAIPLGLIATELLANAFEHAFGAGNTGRLEVRLHHDSHNATLEIVDTGRGLPPGFTLAQANSLGLNIARQFASQLAGTLTLDDRPGGGAIARLVFPLGDQAVSARPH